MHTIGIITMEWGSKTSTKKTHLNFTSLYRLGGLAQFPQFNSLRSMVPPASDSSLAHSDAVGPAPTVTGACLFIYYATFPAADMAHGDIVPTVDELDQAVNADNSFQAGALQKGPSAKDKRHAY